MKHPTTLEPDHSIPQSSETRKPAETLGPDTLHAPDALPNLDLEGDSHSSNHWWIWLLVFAVIGFGCYKLYQFETGKKAAIATSKGMMMRPRSIPVVAASAYRGDMPVYLQGLGTVAPFNTVTVKPRVDGQLIAVTFHEGQFVRKGDLLAEIDPAPFQVALDQAKGNLAQARGNLAKDQAALGDAQANYVRDQQLFNDQIIAKQQMDTQLATTNQYRGSIEADNAAIAAANAAIDNAKLNLSWTRIVAPISGRIGLRQVDAGNMVHASDVNGLAIIAQMQPISVLFSIPEDQLPPVLQKLRAGAKLKAEAYDRDQKQRLAAGTLLTVDNEIDTTTGTSKLKAVFPNQDMTLFPNQFVNVRLWLDTQRGATIIPAVAIQRGPTGTFVYLVQPDSTVTVRAVKVGMSEGNNVSIEDGLQAGEKVVVDGAEKLTDGMKVSLRQPNGAGAGHPSMAGGGRTQGSQE
jgi:multidrug efflux system membrane fusion protein